jgi:hypothetical protein
MICMGTRTELQFAQRAEPAEGTGSKAAGLPCPGLDMLPSIIHFRRLDKKFWTKMRGTPIFRMRRKSPVYRGGP